MYFYIAHIDPVRLCPRCQCLYSPQEADPAELRKIIWKKNAIFNEHPVYYLGNKTTTRDDNVPTSEGESVAGEGGLLHPGVDRVVQARLPGDGVPALLDRRVDRKMYRYVYWLNKERVCVYCVYKKKKNLLDNSKSVVLQNLQKRFLLTKYDTYIISKYNIIQYSH